jgi:hypothetical protein
MQVFPLLSWLVGTVALAINVRAVAALILGLRSRDADVMDRYAGRCVWSVVGLVLLVCGSTAAGSFLMAPLHRLVDPNEKATLLLKALNEQMNCVAFVAVAAIFPSGVALVLHRRALRGKD